MGTVKKPRKKYSGPGHPWEAERIEEEKILTKEYGLKNKKEIWKITSKLRKIKTQAKKLIASTSEQSKTEEEQLILKLVSLGVLNEGSSLDNILEIDTKKLLNRRLQSMVLTKGLARTSKQARQMIAHGHIMINGKKTDIPSYMVTIKEEKDLLYYSNSKFTDKEHPELNMKKKDKRVDVVEMPVKEKPKEIKKPEVKKEAPSHNLYPFRSVLSGINPRRNASISS